MKKLLLLTSLLLATIVSFAQNESVFYVHTVTAGNVLGHITFLDHPLLNANPDARMLVTLNWNPPGGAGLSNSNTTGLYYEVSTQQWGIYNENLAAMAENVAYNVLILKDDATTMVHTATKANTASNYTLLEMAPFVGDNALLVFENHYWNPLEIYNDNETGVWYTGSAWSIFNQNDDPQVAGASHIVMAPGSNMRAFTHFATEDNTIIPEYSVIDHPELNGHPEAIIIMQQNWNPIGGFDVYNNQTMGVWYDGDSQRWIVYSQPLGAIPIGAAFNIVLGYPQPGNDECAAATDIDGLFHNALNTPQVSAMQSNNGATVSDTDPANGNECWFSSDGFDNPVWYSFVGDGEGYNILTTDCSGETGDTYINFGDTQIAVYEGSCGSLTPVACNDDSENSNNDNLYAEVDIQTEDGVTYYIMIDGYSAADGPPADGTFCIQVTQVIVGVEETPVTDFNMYPNPAEDVLNISSGSTISRIEILNSLGQVISTSTNLNRGNISIPCEHLQSGVYFVRVSNDNGSSTQRFVKR